jgi:hypothetical protein
LPEILKEWAAKFHGSLRRSQGLFLLALSAQNLGQVKI